MQGVIEVAGFLRDAGLDFILPFLIKAIYPLAASDAYRPPCRDAGLDSGEVVHSTSSMGRPCRLKVYLSSGGSVIDLATHVSVVPCLCKGRFPFICDDDLEIPLLRAEALQVRPRICNLLEGGKCRSVGRNPHIPAHSHVGSLHADFALAIVGSIARFFPQVVQSFLIKRSLQCASEAQRLFFQ